MVKLLGGVLFGPHERLAVFQMIQALFYNVFAPQVSTAIPGYLTSWRPEIVLFLVLTAWYLLPNSVVVAARRCNSPSRLVGLIYWYPLLIGVLQALQFDDCCFEFGSYPASFLLIGLQWWLKGIYVAAETLLYSLRPPAAPDPRPQLFNCGSQRYWVRYKPKSGHAKPKCHGFVWYPTPAARLAETPFVLALCITILHLLAAFLEGFSKAGSSALDELLAKAPSAPAASNDAAADATTPAASDDAAGDDAPKSPSSYAPTSPLLAQALADLDGEPDLDPAGQPTSSPTPNPGWRSALHAWGSRVFGTYCGHFDFSVGDDTKEDSPIVDLCMWFPRFVSWCITWDETFLDKCIDWLFKLYRKLFERSILFRGQFLSYCLSAPHVCLEAILWSLEPYHWCRRRYCSHFGRPIEPPQPKHCAWPAFYPLRKHLAVLSKPFFDLEGLSAFAVAAPDYPDAAYCVSEETPNDGLNWRLRRHILRVETMVHARRGDTDLVDSTLPDEALPDSTFLMSWMADSYWLWLTDWYRAMRIAEARPRFASSWDKLVHEFVCTHDPSQIVSYFFLASSMHCDEEGCPRVSLPIGRAHDFAIWRTFFASQLHCFSGIIKERLPLIVDTGASVCISPRREDFISYKPSKLKIKDLSSSNKVLGEGMLRWSVRDANGEIVTLELPGYHIPAAEVRLLSPQVLLSLVGGRSLQTSANIQFELDNGICMVANYCQKSNLPMLQTSTAIAPRCALSDAFVYSAGAAKEVTNVLSSSNKGINAAQKEALLWHQRLAHAHMPWIYLLMRNRKWLRDRESDHALHVGPFIPCKEAIAQGSDIKCLKCAACQTAKASVRSPRAEHRHEFRYEAKAISDFTAKINGSKKKILKAGHAKPGDCVSADHYISGTPGRLPNTYGRERRGYTCGTLFIDHASGKIFNFCQLSTSAEETLRSKHTLEAEAKAEGFRIKSFHSDNGTFTSAAFKDDCEQQDQAYTFSGVGAQHQNGVAERNIKTVADWARASMLHAVYCWPAKASVKLWPMAVDYAVWVYNRLPQMDTGLCPNEIWSSCRFAHEDFRRAHVFGCPVYVLEPKLQDGKKIPKWEPRARLGMFVGFSRVHSSLVPLVLNVKTGKISPQYHVVFDDKFETVHSRDDTAPLDKQWERIFKLGREVYCDVVYDSQGRVVESQLPDLGVEWQGDAADAGVDRSAGDDIHFGVPRSAPTATPTSSPVTTTPPVITEERVMEPTTDDASATTDGDGASDASTGGAHGAPGGAAVNPPGNAAPGGAPLRRNPHRAARHPLGDGPSDVFRIPYENDDWDNTIYIAHGDPAVLVANRGRSQEFHPNQKLTKAYLAGLVVDNDPWDDVRTLHASISHDVWDPSLVDDFDPRLLAARANNYSEDTPTWKEAMRSAFQGEWWRACELELGTLEGLESWEYVRRTPEMKGKVLPSKWAFKLKRRPDLEPKKFKARFVVRGDRQKKDVDYFETWSPVVQWSTIRTIMVLAAKFGYKSAQCDITAAFLLAKLPPGEKILVEQPQGFVRDPNYVLRLRRSLYGLKQAPRYFFKYLSARIEKAGLAPSALDPCLFMSDKLIVIVYVDDLLIYAKDDADIEAFIARMKKLDVTLNYEGTAEGFLGVDVKREGSKTTLVQSGLSKRVIEALGLCAKYTSSVETPAECSPLPRDADGEPYDGPINYASVVGMLLYLTGHSRPDIAFAVHQCARYTFEPKRSHVAALKRIGRYLKGTIDQGLILDPNDELRLDCYPDADFAGLWGHEHPQDPHCARSRTGYVICLAGCPVLWSSKLQTAIALSTMEAEYVALSTACKDLFPLVDLVTELSTFMGFKARKSSHLHVKIHEDNVGALTLGNLEPRRMTPRSKHYAIKYHWFRDKLQPGSGYNVKLVKIDTANQLGDIFTKGLGPTIFKRLRKQLMGW